MTLAAHTASACGNSRPAAALPARAAARHASGPIGPGESERFCRYKSDRRTSILQQKISAARSLRMNNLYYAGPARQAKLVVVLTGGCFHAANPQYRQSPWGWVIWQRAPPPVSPNRQPLAGPHHVALGRPRIASAGSTSTMTGKRRCPASGGDSMSETLGLATIFDENGDNGWERRS